MCLSPCENLFLVKFYAFDTQPPSSSCVFSIDWYQGKDFQSCILLTTCFWPWRWWIDAFFCLRKPGFGQVLHFQYPTTFKLLHYLYRLVSANRLSVLIFANDLFLTMTLVNWRVFLRGKTRFWSSSSLSTPNHLRALGSSPLVDIRERTLSLDFCERLVFVLIVGELACFSPCENRFLAKFYTFDTQAPSSSWIISIDWYQGKDSQSCILRTTCFCPCRWWIGVFLPLRKPVFG